MVNNAALDSKFKASSIKKNKDNFGSVERENEFSKSKAGIIIHYIELSTMINFEPLTLQPLSLPQAQADRIWNLSYSYIMQALSRDQVKAYHSIKFSFHSGYSTTESTFFKSIYRVSLNDITHTPKRNVSPNGNRNWRKKLEVTYTINGSLIPGIRPDSSSSPVFSISIVFINRRALIDIYPWPYDNSINLTTLNDQIVEQMWVQ